MSGNWATLSVEGLVRMLPFGPVRDRYRREFISELHGLSPRNQVRLLIGITVSLHSLRRAVTDPHSATYAPRTFHQAWRCRMHLGHRWGDSYTDDGHRFRQCRRCGEDSGASGAGSTDWAAGINIGLGGHTA